MALIKPKDLDLLCLSILLGVDALINILFHFTNIVATYCLTPNFTFFIARLKSLSGCTTVVENGDQPTEAKVVSAPVDENGNVDNGVREPEESKKKKKRKKRKTESSDEFLNKRPKSQLEGVEGLNTQELQQKPRILNDKLGKKNKKKRKDMKEDNTAISILQNTHSAPSTQNAHSDIGLLMNKVSTDINGDAKQNETKQTSTSDNTLNGHSSQFIGHKDKTTVSKKTKHTETSYKQSSDTFSHSSVSDTGTEVQSLNASLNGFEQTSNDLVEEDTKEENPHGKKTRTKDMTAEDKPFAVFQKVKATPPAFVKKAVTKITPKTAPRKTKVRITHVMLT